MAVAPAAIIELILGGVLAPAHGIGGDLVEAFIVAATVEESVKLFFVKHYLFRRAEFDERVDGIVYAICVSLGFAIVENFLYGYRDLRVLFLRAFTSVPLHAEATGVMGYWLGRAKIEGQRDGGKGVGASMAKGLAWAILIHGLYDFLLMEGGLASLLVLPLLVVGWLVLSRS